MFIVVGAVIASNRLVLCAQRSHTQSHPGKWEFPGGKVEPGELAESALKREILEELGCEVAVGNTVTSTHHDYDNFSIQLTTYYCSILSGEPTVLEHQQLKWVAIDKLTELDWAEADLPTVQQVMHDFCAVSEQYPESKRLGRQRPGSL